ncbi:MAG TPA: hypothetical protein VFJ97_10785 [Dermatophilaceae bacterium]|nr:hypothetical protein [Dermatophilaceae bacterium]
MVAPIPLHGIGTRGDLPLPFPFVVGGAAAALAVSFAVLFLAWRTPRYDSVGGFQLPALTAVVDHPGFRWGARAAVLTVYVWSGMALVAGKDLLTNPVFGFVYAWMWVGLVPLSLLLGPFWRATNPLRTIHSTLCWIARTDPEQGLVRLPRSLGIWPAAVGLFAFAFLELVQPDRTTLVVLRLWALMWLVVLVLGAVVLGRRWIGAADPFESYATAVAQLSVWRRVGDQIRLVNPLAGLSRWTPPPGLPAVVSVLLGATAFDSFSNTSWWISTVQSSELSATLWATSGLVAMTVIVFSTFCAASVSMARYRNDRAVRVLDFPRLMSASVIPIVIGYVVAHYATLLLVEGQRTAITMSDPLGRGWNVLGSAEMGVNTAIFDHPTVIACVQLGAIMLGHLIGIVVAHEKSVALVRPTAALAAQWPMLVVMISYTCSGLLLLFSP